MRSAVARHKQRIAALTYYSVRIANVAYKTKLCLLCGVYVALARHKLARRRRRTEYHCVYLMNVTYKINLKFVHSKIKFKFATYKMKLKFITAFSTNVLNVSYKIKLKFTYVLLLCGVYVALFSTSVARHKLARRRRRIE